MSSVQIAIPLDESSGQPEDCEIDRALEMRRLLEVSRTRALNASEMGELSYLSSHASGPSYVSLLRDPQLLRRICETAMSNTAGGPVLRRGLCIDTYTRFRQIAEYELAYHAAECGLRIALAAGDDHAILDAQVVLVAASANALDYRTTLVLYRRTMQMAEETGDETAMVKLHHLMARFALYGGHPSEAIRHATVAVGLAANGEPHRFVGLATRCRTMLAYAQFVVGDVQVALATLQSNSAPEPLIGRTRDASNHNAGFAHMVACLIAADARDYTLLTYHRMRASTLANAHPSSGAVVRSQICDAAAAIAGDEPAKALSLLLPLYRTGPKRAYYWMDAALALTRVYATMEETPEAKAVREELIQVRREMATTRISGAITTAMALHVSEHVPERPPAWTVTSEARSSSHRGILAAARRSALMASHSFDPTGHPARVGAIAKLFALHLGFGPETAHEIATAAELAGLGLLTIPQSRHHEVDPIIRGDAQLARQLVVQGLRIAEGIAGLTENQFVLPSISGHREWWDGTGAPDGLAGGAIHDAARITALALVFDSLVHPRRWRGPLSVAAALEVMLNAADTQFKGSEVAAFAEMIETIERLRPGGLQAYIQSQVVPIG